MTAEQVPMHDSGERQSFDTGAVRDASVGKVSYRLLSPYLLERWPMIEVRAQHQLGNDPAMPGQRAANAWVLIQAFRAQLYPTDLDRAAAEVVCEIGSGEEALRRLSDWCERGAAKYGTSVQVSVDEAPKLLGRWCTCGYHTSGNRPSAIRTDITRATDGASTVTSKSTQGHDVPNATQTGRLSCRPPHSARPVTTSSGGRLTQITSSAANRAPELGPDGTPSTGEPTTLQARPASAAGSGTLLPSTDSRPSATTSCLKPKGAVAQSAAIHQEPGDFGSSPITTTRPELFGDSCAGPVTPESECLETMRTGLLAHSHTCDLRQRVTLQLTPDGGKGILLSLRGDRNWEKGMPLSRVLDSMQRHVRKWVLGDATEDHLAAILWNIMAVVHYVAEIWSGGLPETLDDLPRYGQKAEVMKCAE